MTKAILLDFDDTLCLTEAAGFALENEALRMLNRPPQPREVHKKTWGQPLFDAISVRSPGVNVTAFREMVQILLPKWVREGKIDAISEANLYTLDCLLETGRDIYIVTSRVRDELHHILKPDHVLAGRVKAFYYHEVLAYHKPDPRVFDTVLKVHGLRPSECVYVGDSLSDAAAAKQAGLYFVATLESGLRTKQDFQDWAVDTFITCFTDLPDVVRRL